MSMRPSNALYRAADLRTAPPRALSRGAPKPPDSKTKGPAEASPLTTGSHPRTGWARLSGRRGGPQGLEGQTEAELDVARGLPRLQLVEVLVRRGRLVRLQAGGGIDRLQVRQIGRGA